MMRPGIARRFAIFAALALSCGLDCARADPVEDFYKGKIVTIVVGSPAGGIYDLYARNLARIIPRHLPGSPTVIVQNQPSSGATSSTNFLYQGAPQDGTVIGAPTGTTPFQPVLGITQAIYDPTKMIWLGSPTSELAIFVVWNSVPVNSIADARTRELLVGSNGPNGTSGFYGKVINDVFKTKLKPIYGYSGLADSFLAMQRGEVEGYVSIFWNQFKTAYADLIRDKKIKFILQYGPKPHPDLPTVPFAADLISSPDDKRLFDAALAPLAVGYPLVMGPNVPADRARAMIQAVAETFRDKDFVDEAAKEKLEVNPVSAAETQKIMAATYGMPKDLIDRLRVLYTAQ